MVLLYLELQHHQLKKCSWNWSINCWCYYRNFIHGDGSNLTGLASREVYGFTGIGKSLSLTTTNSGADNIDNATYAAFEENFIGPSGLSFSINTSGNLIMTV